MEKNRKGVIHTNLKLAYFVCYLKIINTFLKHNIGILSNLSKELKIGIEILVGQSVFKLRIKTVKILFWLIMQQPLGLLKF